MNNKVSFWKALIYENCSIKNICSASISAGEIHTYFVKGLICVVNISYDYFGFTIPLSARNVFGLNITSVTMEEMEVTTMAMAPAKEDLLQILTI